VWLVTSALPPSQRPLKLVSIRVVCGGQARCLKERSTLCGSSLLSAPDVHQTHSFHQTCVHQSDCNEPHLLGMVTRGSQSPAQYFVWGFITQRLMSIKLKFYQTQSIRVIPYVVTYPPRTWSATTPRSNFVVLFTFPKAPDVHQTHEFPSTCVHQSDPVMVTLAHA
jgi:hypothetical protein